MPMMFVFLVMCSAKDLPLPVGFFSFRNAQRMFLLFRNHLSWVWSQRKASAMALITWWIPRSSPGHSAVSKPPYAGSKLMFFTFSIAHSCEGYWRDGSVGDLLGSPIIETSLIESCSGYERCCSTCDSNSMICQESFCLTVKNEVDGRLVRAKQQLHEWWKLLLELSFDIRNADGI